MSTARLDGIALWGLEFLLGRPDLVPDAAAEVEELGYGAIWYPGGAGGPVLEVGAGLLAATQRVPVGIGILNLWKHEPAEVAASFAAMDRAHPDRFVLGIGSSHKTMVDTGARPDRYSRPWSAMNRFLDDLDDAAVPVPADQRVLAALGPRMMETARSRSAGVHSFFVTAEHTAQAREALGPDPVLAPQHAVVLEADPSRAREIARRYTGVYLSFPHYSNNLRRLGWTEDDVRGGGSDSLVDALVAWGDLEQIRKRVRAHLDAGADQVCLQVIPDGWGPPFKPPIETFPLREWRELAAALIT